MTNAGSLSPASWRHPAAARTGKGGGIRLALGLLVLLAVLALARLYTYELFHSLAELFSVCVALAVAAIAWHTRRIANNPFLLFLGLTLAIVAVNDTLHMLAYQGMGVFRTDGADLPTQLWLAGRYVFTLGFLVAPFLIGKSVHTMSISVAGLAGVWVLLMLSIFAWHVFPTALVEGEGLTAFKKISEYGVSFLLLVALGLLLAKGEAFEPRILRLLSGVIVLTIVSELSFTLYSDPFGLLNLVGHYLKILAFFFLYLAIVERTLVAPYSLLFRGLREREARLEGIRRVNEAAMRSLELHDLMDSVLRRIVEIMEAQAALIMLNRGGRLVAVASCGFGDGLVEDFTLCFGEGVAGRVAQTGRPLRIDDVQNDRRVIHPIVVERGIRTMLAVPLLRGKEILGVLHVDWTEQKDVAGADIRFLELLADRVAVAIFNADLYRKQKEVAEALQSELLVLPFEIPGVRFGHVYRSASEGAHVGGDFYDLFADASRLWLVMGDVSGHGVQAATTAALIREVTRAFIVEVGKPAEIMQMVNRSVVQRLGFRHYATLFLGVLDLERGILTYCSAGHPPGLVIREDRTVTELTSRSLPVGAFPNTTYQATCLALGPGDCIFLYTDGVTEARSGQEFFGEERLVQVLGSPYSPDVLPQKVFEAVERFAEGRLKDDVAALCVAPDIR